MDAKNGLAEKYTQKHTTDRGNEMTMTYEQFLDEITTLIYEKYDVSEDDAIKFVVRAQASDYFSRHDEDPLMRTQERAEYDAKIIYDQRNKSNPKVFRNAPHR